MTLGASAMPVSQRKDPEWCRHLACGLSGIESAEDKSGNPARNKKGELAMAFPPILRGFSC